MVKILHTADWHLGIKYTHLGENADKARQIRIETVRKLIKTAKNENVDFILVAGDLFDSNDLDRSIVNTVAEILASATPIPIYLLPGNHDPLTKDSLYHEKAWQAADNVIIIKENEPLEIPYHEIIIYPCPVTQKQSKKDPTEWIESNVHELSIGLAHGNLRIPGFTDETNFPINPERADIANLDYLALGEWHSFSEYANNGIKRTIYPGTPEQTQYKESNSGKAVIVELEKPGSVPLIKTIPSGTLSWEVLESNINNLNDLKNLEIELKQIENPLKKIIRLNLNGVISQETFEYLEDFQNNWQDNFLSFELNSRELLLEPSMMEFKAVLPEGTLLLSTFKSLMALMKIDNTYRDISDISPEEAENIFRKIKHLESVQKVSPEVLQKASVLLYQMIKEASL